jgi:hypothetical protein
MALVLDKYVKKFKNNKKECSAVTKDTGYIEGGIDEIQ